MRSLLAALGLVIGAALPGVPLSVSAGTDASLAADLASSPLWLGLIGGGLLAVAALALIGGAWLGARRRQRQASEARPPDRRARLVRRRPVADVDDPIVTAMGLGRTRPPVERPRGSEPAAGSNTHSKRTPRI